jgi:hypothetical protein
MVSFSQVMFHNFRLIILFLCFFPGIHAQHVVINEVMTANASAVLDPVYYNYSEWIELYNPASQAVFISGYRLSNDPSDLGLWKVPAATYIPANGFIVIWMDKLNRGLHTNFRIRSDDELIFLSNTSGVLVDTIHIQKMYRNASYGRNPDGAINRVLFLTPTPGATNSGTIISDRSPEPVFSLPGGRYSGSQALTLTSPGSTGKIYYTIDGSEPGLNSSLYNGPLTVSTTKTIKARIIETGKAFGHTVTNTFFISEHAFTIPVVSVSTNPVNLWDPVKGIYVEGTNGVEGFCYDKANWNREWERQATFEYFTPDGSKKISTDAGISINGGCSRTNPQKSLGVYFRDKYGPDEIKYPLFISKDVDHFKSIMLRNSGNDFNRTQMQDAMMQTFIMGQMDIDYMAYSPAALYLNGVYWGIQNIREKSSSDYLYTNYGLDPDSVDLLESYYSVLEGDNSDFTAMISFLNSHNLTSAENYNYVTSRIDLESYIDYMIAEIYFANTDWPGNNIKYWKAKKPGSKWRWLLYDTDFGFGLYTNPDLNTLTFASEAQGPDWPNPPWSTLLFRKLLGNEDFKKRFVDKINVYINSTFNPLRINAVIDSLSNNISKEMPYHFLRWGGSMSSWRNNLDVNRNFGNRRPFYMMQYLADFFGLYPPVTLTLNSNLKENERFSVNDIVIHDTAFTGPYFGNREVKVKALSGYASSFNHWEITTYNSLREELVSTSSQWQYYDLGTAVPSQWASPLFDDSSWKTGIGRFGYGNGNEVTTISYGPDANNKYVTSYYRKKFTVNDTTGADSLMVSILADDGAIVYLNGTEIARVNMPGGKVTYSTLASANPVDENAFITFNVNKKLLKAGENMIAAEVHQVAVNSSDLTFDAKLALISKKDVHLENNTNPEIVLNLTTSADCRAFFDEEPVLHHIYINEFCAKNSIIPDEDGEFDDWIELYNAGQDTVNLSGLYMTNSLSNPLAFKIPTARGSETQLPPGEYKILWADCEPEEGTLHLDFNLDKDGGEIAIIELAQGRPIVLDSVEYHQQYTNYSYGRYADGTSRWFVLSGMTPGTSNLYTGITELPPDNGIEIYPNPVGDYLEIHLTEPDVNDLDISIIDQLGREKVRRSIDGQGGQIDASALPPGIYMMRIKGTDSSFVRKLIKW